MAKNIRKDIKPAEQKKEPINKVKAAAAPHQYSIFDFRTQAIILAIIGFVFYANSISNEYAFDDMMAIVDNAYVQKGVAGIGDIMTHDAYQSYLEQRNGGNELAGGRYRPLSLISFAIEQQILGVSEPTENANTSADRTPELERKLVRDMHIRHFLNVILYILSVIVLLHFLRRIVFPDDPLLPFLAVVLFTIHPLHTEVVANVKSRDEILSVLFISLTFIKAFSYKATQKTKDLVWACVFFFLALLSKEYAAMLVVLLPLAFYLFGKESVKNSFKSCLPYLIPMAVYILFRRTAITGAMEGAEKDIMNNPYFYATVSQKMATVTMVLFNYIKLLFIPYPMVADYSFNQIPYTNFNNPIVWVSLVVHGGMFISMCWLIIKRHFLGFALAVYLVNLSLISNIFFNIGAPMGERLIYHSSIGFCIIIAWLLYKGYKSIPAESTANNVLGTIMAVLIVCCAYTTIARNPDWKNNNTLFLTDVKKSPNSALVNVNAGAACMMLAKQVGDSPKRIEWFKKAIDFFSQTIVINPTHYFAYVNRGLCEFNMGYQAKAVSDWDTVRKYTPQQVNVNRYMDIAGKYFFGLGNKYKADNKPDSALYAFKIAVDAAPNVGELWFNLGNSYFAVGNIHEATKALEKANQLLPNNQQVAGFYAQLKALDK